MSSDTWRTIVGVVIATHGIGHVLFLVPSLGLARWGQSQGSALLTKLLGTTGGRIAGGLLWFIVMVACLAAGVGIVGQIAWWRSLSVAAAAASLALLALYLDGKASAGATNAGLFDIVILVALLVFRWPPATLIGP